MGWLGWEPEVVLATDVNLVIMALDSRSDLISMVFGDGKKRPTGRRKKKITLHDFRRFAEQHNRGKRDLDG